MAEYLVYIETVGDPAASKGPVAHVPALPGAAVRGSSIAEAKEKIRGAVEEYIRLLREAGEPVPRVGDGIHLEFQEVDTTTFPADYTALREEEFETLLRWLAISRQELVDLVKELAEDALDWQPDEETASIRQILCRLAEADLWYSDRLKRWPDVPLFRLAAARGMALERLRGLSETEWGDITLYAGEQWNPRKVIRRMLEFEREQIYQIKTLLAARSSG